MVKTNKETRYKQLEGMYGRMVPITGEMAKELTDFSVENNYMDKVWEVISTITNEISSAVIRGEYKVVIHFNEMKEPFEGIFSDKYLKKRIFYFEDIGYNVEDLNDGRYAIRWDNIKTTEV